MVAPKAHFFLDSYVESLTEFSRLLKNKEIDFSAYISVISFESLDQYDSNELVNASQPLFAARFAGIEIVKSGSMIAISG